MHESTHRADLIQSLLPRVKALSNRRARDAQRCFWIEGIRNFVRAHDAKLHFQIIVHSPILLKSDCAEMLSRRLCAGGVRRLRVSPEEFRLFSAAPRASGIGAIVTQHWSRLAEIAATAGRFLLAVEQIRSPGNLGTILRTAEATGCGGVIFVGPHCDPFDPAVVRASMGGVFHLPLVRTTADALQAWSAANRVRIVGLSPRAARLWTDLPDDGRIAFVLGEERHGLSEGLSALCHCTVRLPIVGRADSLNVSVVAGVAMYEMVRRAEPTAIRTLQPD
jgi:TrmH family RNA methyltransferase